MELRVAVGSEGDTSVTQCVVRLSGPLEWG